jgi:hypothetical protein
MAQNLSHLYGIMCHNYGMKTKKTTLMIDVELYSALRQKAAERGQSVSLVACEAIAAYVVPQPNDPKQRLNLVTASGGGWIGPLNPTSNRELLDLIDEDDDILRLG